jgi:hypothetical protein
MSEFAMDLFERYAKPKEPKPEPRPPWRPKTRTPEHYAKLIKAHQEISEWFLASFGRPHKSDSELLRAHLVDELQKVGLRAGRVNEKEMSGKIKTMQNELSSARQLFPESRKGAIK